MPHFPPPLGRVGWGPAFRYFLGAVRILEFMRVLLIEDDRRLAASIQRGLGESGLAVDIVHQGNEGIAAVLSTPYDVVVIDVMLPGADGLSVSPQLRQQNVSAPLPTLTA